MLLTLKKLKKEKLKEMPRGAVLKTVHLMNHFSNHALLIMVNETSNRGQFFETSID